MVVAQAVMIRPGRRLAGGCGYPFLDNDSLHVSFKMSVVHSSFDEDMHAIVAIVGALPLFMCED